MVLRQIGVDRNRCQHLLTHARTGRTSRRKEGFRCKSRAYHVGQFFPWTWMRGEFIASSCTGSPHRKDADLYSSGGRNWGPPLRLVPARRSVLFQFDENCEITPGMATEPRSAAEKSINNSETRVGSSCWSQCVRLRGEKFSVVAVAQTS